MNIKNILLAALITTTFVTNSIVATEESDSAAKKSLYVKTAIASSIIATIAFPLTSTAIKTLNLPNVLDAHQANQVAYVIALILWNTVKQCVQPCVNSCFTQQKLDIDIPTAVINGAVLGAVSRSTTFILYQRTRADKSPSEITKSIITSTVLNAGSALGLHVLSLLRETEGQKKLYQQVQNLYPKTS